MRIMFIITRAERGGAQSHLLELVRGLVSEHDILLLSGEDGPLLQKACALGARIRIIQDLVHPIRPARDIAAVLAVRGAIRSFAPNLIHAHSSKAGVVGRVAAKLAGVPAIFTAHGWAFAEGTPPHRRLVALAFEKICGYFSSAIIVVSEYDRHLALRFRIADTRKLVVIHNGIPQHEVHLPADRAQGKEIAVVMTARFAPAKDQLLLIRALGMLPVNVKARFLGAGPTLSSCRREAELLGVASRVSFLGDRSDVDEQLAAADIFALPSNYEGLPISIIEAMRAGLPVVASDVGGVAELVDEGHTGFLVPKGSLEALTQRLHELATSRSLRLELGRNGRAKFERQFSSRSMLSSTLDVYRSVLRLS